MYKLSIITVCYNSENTIEETIESIVSQKNDLVEYIIIDGASTDNTMKIVGKYRDCIDKVISEKDNGISDAFNKGIQIADGEYIGIINSDDMLTPNAIEHLMKDLDGKADVIYGNGIRLFSDGMCKPYMSAGDPETLHKDMTFCHPATFVKKEAYEKWGMFSTDYKCVMDRELLLRFLNSGATFRYTNKYYAIYRMGGMSDSLYMKHVLPEMYRIDTNDGMESGVARKAKLKRRLIFCLVKIRSDLGMDRKRRPYAEMLRECSEMENQGR